MACRRANLWYTIPMQRQNETMMRAKSVAKIRLLVGVACAVGLVYTAVGARVNFRAQVDAPVEHVPGFLWIEAEGFAKYGSWQVDTQFTHKMGSAYLICPGANTPAPHPARTEISIPRAGTWRAWVRTKD